MGICWASPTLKIWQRFTYTLQLVVSIGLCAPMQFLQKADFVQLVSA